MQETVSPSTCQSHQMKPTANNYNESPHRIRVFYQRYMNQVNQALQSLITAGKMKRMELMSINNRALFNRGKVQRVQWMTKKYPLGNSQFLPDIKSISINNRSPSKSKQKLRFLTQGNKQTYSKNDQNEDKLIDELVENEVNRMKNDGTLRSGRLREDIVKQACKIIQEKYDEAKKKNQKIYAQIHIPRKRSRTNFQKFRREHRRSVTESLYHQQIKGLEKKQHAVMKLRENDKKSFLRKIESFNKCK